MYSTKPRHSERLNKFKRQLQCKSIDQRCKIRVFKVSERRKINENCKTRPYQNCILRLHRRATFRLHLNSPARMLLRCKPSLYLTKRFLANLDFCCAAERPVNIRGGRVWQQIYSKKLYTLDNSA